MARLRERLVEATASVNEVLRDRALSHSLYMERLKTQEVNQIIGMLNRVTIPNMLDKLAKRLERIAERGYDLGPVTTQRLRDAIAATNEILRGGLQEAGQKLRNDLKPMMVTEAEWQARLLRERTKGMGLSFAIPNVRTLNSIITSRPMQGKLLSKWWGELSVASRKLVGQQISLGIAEGEGIAQIVRRLKGTRAMNYADGILQQVRRHVQTNVRTSVSHVVNHAREATYKENEDIVKGVQYVATLDARTTETCMSLDGEVFPVDDGPRPPQHHNCRSNTIPVLKSWKELGIDLKEAPEGTRASMNGQVPETQSYQDWLRRQTVEVQNEALGPTRAQMFRSGDVTIDRFVDRRHQPLTLEQIRQREGL